MIAIMDLNGPNDTQLERNRNRSIGHYPRCVVCDLPIQNTQRSIGVLVHRGGSHVVTEAEYDELETTNPGAGLGTQYIGSECARKNRDALKPFLL